LATSSLRAPQSAIALLPAQQFFDFIECDDHPAIRWSYENSHVIFAQHIPYKLFTGGFSARFIAQ
jgi:hypothetical protein